MACVELEDRLAGAPAEPLQSLPQQGLHAARYVCLAEECLGRFRIVANQVVSRFSI
jgi:hypothetical protein